MIRTKYLLLAIFGCIVLIFGFGTWSIERRDARVSGDRVENMFATPSERYRVVSQTDTDMQNDRTLFIEHVRSSLEQAQAPTAIEGLPQEDTVVSSSTQSAGNESNTTSNESVSDTPQVDTVGTTSIPEVTESVLQ
jgi:hypothetical protein